MGPITGHAFPSLVVKHTFLEVYDEDREHALRCVQRRSESAPSRCHRSETGRHGEHAISEAEVLPSRGAARGGRSLRKPRCYDNCESSVGQVDAAKKSVHERPITLEAPANEKAVTTVMVRNFACRFTCDQVMSFLDDVGLKGKYDFLHLPLNPTRRANLGYMFVNFTTPEFAEECKELLQGKALGLSSSEKRCEVTTARIQGTSAASKRPSKRPGLQHCIPGSR